jgi:hypothetical protein
MAGERKVGVGWRAMISCLKDTDYRKIKLLVFYGVI